MSAASFLHPPPPGCTGACAGTKKLAETRTRGGPIADHRAGATRIVASSYWLSHRTRRLGRAQASSFHLGVERSVRCGAAAFWHATRCAIDATD